jgi:pimeloyl-ACP methyl ester carboxylesterase
MLIFNTTTMSRFFLFFAVILAAVPSPVVGWFTAAGARKAAVPATTVPSNARLLILPGFGNNSEDYFLPQAPQGSLVASLQKRGWSADQICVLPLQRTDWLQVFWNGAFDLEFWQANASADRPAFAWYLNRVADCIRELTAEDDDASVVLIGHSAGGWLARAALGHFSGTSQEEEPNEACNIDRGRVLGMVTLGSPHLPPPPQVMDMTRGALRITNERFPGAFHRNEGLFYITAIGDAVQGAKQERTNPLEKTTATGFAYNSYQAVCGQGDTIGDGVVPVSAGHLDDATQLDLEGIFHSVNVPDQWYGSDNVIDSWYTTMLQEIAARTENKKNPQGFSLNLERIFKPQN